MSSTAPTLTCRYCGSPTRLTGSAEVYNGRDYGMIYLCTLWPDCDAFVGAHRDTLLPKGETANKELRQWRVRTHAAGPEHGFARMQVMSELRQDVMKIFYPDPK